MVVVSVVVAVLHLGFMVLESFLWTHRIGRKTFGLSKEDAEKTKVLAFNQGMYNGALGVALLGAAATGEVTTMMVLLGFVVFVGLVGAVSVKWTIAVVQALPAAIGLALGWMG